MFFYANVRFCFEIFYRRKRGEKGEVVETVEDVIVRKLTAERVEELKKVIKETQEKYRYLAEGMPNGWEKPKGLTFGTGQNFLNNRLKDPVNSFLFISRRLKRDAELIQAGHMDSRLDELCNDIVMWVILYCSFFCIPSSVFTPFLLKYSGLSPPSAIPLVLSDSGREKLPHGLVAGRGE